MASPARRPFDADGRPFIDPHLKVGVRPLPIVCGRVLYSLALTELQGNKLGLTRRSIRKVMQHEQDERAGEWDWLFDDTISLTESGKINIRNAVHSLLVDYPIVVLQPGTYVDVPQLPRRDGRMPDVYKLNAAAIERWPCGAHIITLLSIGIHQTPIDYATLKLHMDEVHRSHNVPAGIQQPKPHSLREDIAFLIQARYLKVFTHELGHPKRRELSPKDVSDSDTLDPLIIDLDDRANWEQTYLHRLARHYVSDETGKQKAKGGYAAEPSANPTGPIDILCGD
jgi:hypothetical protein